MPINRSQIKSSPLPKETVHFAPLGGEVIVRGLRLAEQMANERRTVQERSLRDGETAEEALSRANAVMAVRIASQAVIDPDDGEPLMSVAEWEPIAAAHPTEFFDLAAVALRLSGSQVADLEKN